MPLNQHYIDQEAWDGFVEMRKSINKKAWTPRAEKMALKKLEMFYNQGHDVNEILDQSTFMGWKGLFPVKGESNGQSNNGKFGGAVSRRDQTRAAIDSLTGESAADSEWPEKTIELRLIK